MFNLSTIQSSPSLLSEETKSQKRQGTCTKPGGSRRGADRGLESQVHLELRKKWESLAPYFATGQDFHRVACERIVLRIISKSPKLRGYHDQRQGASINGAFTRCCAPSWPLVAMTLLPLWMAAADLRSEPWGWWKHPKGVSFPGLVFLMLFTLLKNYVIKSFLNQVSKFSPWGKYKSRDKVRRCLQELRGWGTQATAWAGGAGQG